VNVNWDSHQTGKNPFVLLICSARGDEGCVTYVVDGNITYRAQMTVNSKLVIKIEVLLTLYMHRADRPHTAENVISLEHKREKYGCNAGRFWFRVCSSASFCVRMEKLDCHRKNLHENLCSRLLITFVGTVKFRINTDYSNRRFTYRMSHYLPNPAFL